MLKFIGLFTVLIFFITSLMLFYDNEKKNEFETVLENSGPYIGATYPNSFGVYGQGIKIAIIDTGVNYNHPDLYGFGDNGKVVGGYDFVENDNLPMDTDGHGTQVAGVIAANGNIKGISPESKILAYRVSADGEGVASELISKAIHQAIIDKADIINISLGVNRTDNEIDSAVNTAVDAGIVVVAAAGNSGPESNTIGSPASNPNAITVGATYNNVANSLVSTLEINEKQFEAFPMVGTKSIKSPIIAEIRFGEYSRDKDLENLNVKDIILLAERGGETDDELVFFSDKEKNAAKYGASAIIVYNNRPGIFFGELIHEFVEDGYKPSIPAVSINQQDGLEIKKMLGKNITGELNVFYHPDFVAYFSSRGPVSHFFIKPDLVAPGVFVNTTTSNNGYNMTTGTSYAAPHVSGTIALLLEKNPDLKPNEIKSILVTTADPVTDSYGKKFSVDETGSGRINVTKAYNADLIISPTSLKFDFSNEKKLDVKELKIKSLSESLDDLNVTFEETENIKFTHKLEDNILKISSNLYDNYEEEYESRVLLKHNDVVYQIPIQIYINHATFVTLENDGLMHFEITNPVDWVYAKFTVTNKDTQISQTTSITPKKSDGISGLVGGEYWIEANIRTENDTTKSYQTVYVESDLEKEKSSFNSSFQFPQKPIIIIIVIIVIVAVIGVIIRKYS